MGKWGARIGLYWLEMSDYNVSDLPETSKTSAVYKKRKADLWFVFVGDKHNERKEEKIQMPLIDIIPVKSVKDKYQLDYSKFNLEKTLWKVLRKKGIVIWVNPYIVAVNYNDPVKSSIFYLNSPLLRSFVTLHSIKSAPINLVAYEDIEWLCKHNLRYDQ